ncbi:C6 zinc finger domain protein [Exophiala viscosa]|uniref:C6 zinc finger domain protein n=1 Tax=Exophiala viscosa TaxID=2486360 RepID=UPI00218DA35B|nr:C6 zinc finger domain protein [Exophiala viscosa]
MSTTTTITESGATRKKLARPPVKVACTSCRASRTRCDGVKPVCQNCLMRSNECRYLKSNRGGPRVSSKKASLVEGRRQQTGSNGEQDQQLNPLMDTDIDWSSLMLSPEELHNELIGSMIAPGAGLLDLDLDNKSHSDEIFDSIFVEAPKADDIVFDVFDSSIQSLPYNPVIRHYSHNKAILNAYYIFIHPYFPILPPPQATLDVDDPASESTVFEPASPLVMALLAILVLIPHPGDLFPDSDESVCQRRQEAHSYSQMAMESIEVETELLESATSPSAALEHSVLAHAVLSIYEYAQRGNLAKMRNRASQAYDAAIRLGLHDITDLPPDECTEARRRAWWMTYIVVLQSAIVSNTPPIITIDFHQFRSPLPTITSDTNAWYFFIEAQQVILRCTQYTVALKKALDTGMDPNTLHDKKAMLDNDIDMILQKHSTPQGEVDFSSPPTDFEEWTVAKSLRSQALIKVNSARIKLHRYRAFQDVPVFTRKHCDLDQTDASTPRQLGCACHSVGPRMSPVSTTLPGGRKSTTPSLPDTNNNEPFNDPSAAKTCLKAALVIGRAFEALPLPNPIQLPLPVCAPSMLSISSTTQAPRTMPAFACCAMQSCYTLLTLCYRSLERQCMYQRSLAADKGLEELYAGVARVLAALQNYSIAFEALNGMTRK